MALLSKEPSSKSVLDERAFSIFLKASETRESNSAVTPGEKRKLGAASIPGPGLLSEACVSRVDGAGMVSSNVQRRF